LIVFFRMGYTDELWDGFEIVRNKAKEGAHFNDETAKYLQKYASLANTFGKGLQNLAKTKITNETDTTLADSWQSFVDATDNIAKIFIDFSDQLLKTPEIILNNIKERKKKKKILNTNGKKLIEELKKSEATMSKSKVNFYKLRKKQDESMDEYNKAKSSQTANVVTKLGKKADQDGKAAEKGDKEYADSVKKYKLTQEKVYREEMPKILQEFQVMEEERIKGMKTHLETVLSLQEPIPENMKQINQSISKAIQSINSEKDIDTFVKKNKNSKTGPDYAIYEPYDDANPNNTTTTSPSSLNQQRNSFPPQTTVSTASSYPSLSSNSPTNNAKGSFLNISKEILKSKETSSAGKKDNSVKALYDYNATDENELTFKANETITVLQKDDSGWWQGELSNGKIGMFPSNFVKSFDVEDSKSSSSSSYNDPYRGKICRCLYDYEAADNDELSMKEGDKMTIDSEDNGWYYVKSTAGKYGRIPSNYVELQK